MPLVLDTCALVALAEGEAMRRTAIAAIEAAQDDQALYVSSFVALEVAQKMAVGKLVLSKTGARTWFDHAVRSFGLTEVPCRPTWRSPRMSCPSLSTRTRRIA